MAVPYTFGTATAAIPLSQLDSNFSTTITLGNTAIQLGNTVTTLNNMTLANVTISSGNVTITNVSVTTANITTANISTSIITTSETLSYGTANGVTYLNGSKVLTSGSALTFDGTTLQNSATNAKLSALNVGGTGGGGLYLGSGASTDFILNFDSTPYVKYNSVNSWPHTWTFGATEAMRLTSTGLGIGTSSPAAKLQVANSFAGTNDLQTISRFDRASSGTAANGLGGRLEFSAQDNAGSQRTAAWLNWKLADVSSGGPKGYLSLGSRGTAEALIIDDSGNLGLGVTPSGWTSYKAFQVGTMGSFADSTTGNIDLSANRYNASGDKYIGTGYASMLRQVDGAFKFFTAPSGTAGNAITFTQAMTLDASGNLLVGTTTVPNVGLTGQFGFSVSSTEVVISKDGSDGLIIRTTAGASNNIRLYNLNNQVGSVSTTTSATAYNTSSDYRLKNTIAPMTGALARVAALKPVTYKWNVDSSDGEGFIAHELAEVVPQCVTGEKDAVDAEGKPVYQGIDTSFLVATLTAAMQEQQALIQDLTTRLAALEAK